MGTKFPNESIFIAQLDNKFYCFLLNKENICIFVRQQKFAPNTMFGIQPNISQLK